MILPREFRDGLVQNARMGEFVNTFPKKDNVNDYVVVLIRE